MAELKKKKIDMKKKTKKNLQRKKTAKKGLQFLMNWNLRKTMKLQRRKG